MDRRLVSISEAAEFLGVHPKTVRRRIAAGDLTGYRVSSRLIRIDADELEASVRPIPNAAASPAA